MNQPTTTEYTAAKVRRDFLDFFAAREHKEVPSGPVFPQDDPTLLFTNAGMNQFKDVFLGSGTRAYTRATDTQKCIRVSGKHNDLEEVGVDTYHHTFFEMLGNWSFGDYFKEDSIVWAWELLTKVWGLPKERIWVTVFGGDKKDGLGPDVEAEKIWLEKTDIAPERVLRFDRRDNFWEMGDTGPCGPCSEIHIDRGGPDSDPADGADLEIGVNAGNERFIELWNLVFMQFNRIDDGSLQKLKDTHVDTGMGFERILSVLQGKLSNYDTDLFGPIFERVSKISGIEYTAADTKTDIAFRVIADHVRAVSVAFADGALPSNTGRGYVLRRLIRRASRYGRQALNIEEPFLCDVAPVVAEILGEAFPEIPSRIEHIQALIRDEEESFGKTLGRGLSQFEKLSSKVGSDKVLPGKAAYELYSTFGFPQDLVELMCRERGFELDIESWDAAQKAHADASRSEGKFKQLLSAEQLDGLKPTVVTYRESGNAGEITETVLTEVVRAETEDGEDRLVLEKSPFYAESGGQVGDAGVIEAQDGSFRVEVQNTLKLGEIAVHIGRMEGTPKVGAPVIAQVDSTRRERIKKHHTATHLLHKALREVLGDHVTQAGSYVGPDRLRFDLSHPKGVTPEELDEIERRVNTHILENASVETTVEDLDAAKKRGVTALFGEKYDDLVRVVDIDGWSTELCGGIHVSAAGDIGSFVILSERAIQAGVRRIEAVCGIVAIEEVQRQRQLLQTAARTLKATPEELSERIGALQKQLKEAKKKSAAASGADLDTAFAEAKAKLETRSGITTGAFLFPTLGMKALGDLAGRLAAAGPDHALCLLGGEEGKVPFLVICSGAALEQGLGAGDLAKGLRPILGGGGGGKPAKAQGQGLDPAKAEDALHYLQEALQKALEG